MPDDELLAYDFSRPYDRGDWWNKGCPPGYFAQFVAKDATLSADYGNPWTGVRCRLAASSTPMTLAQESGISAWEALAHFNAAVTETAGEVTSFAIPAAVWLALALLVWSQMQRGPTHEGGH